MKGRTYVYSVNDPVVRAVGAVKVTYLSEPLRLKQLQEAVGGYIESVPLWNTYIHNGRPVSCVAYCNEEGKLNGLSLNAAATRDWSAAMLRIVEEGEQVYPRGLLGADGRPSDVLVGDIVVVVGDEEFMRDHIVGYDASEDDEDYDDEDWWPYGDFIPMED